MCGHMESMCDLGVIIQSNLKFALQCNNLIEKAQNLLNNALNAVKIMPMTLLKKFYTCSVRPVLETATEVLYPIQNGYIDRVESMHKYFTRHVVGSETLSYQGRLHRLHL